MPRIPDNRIDDFIARWKRAFGEQLTRDQACMEANHVLYLYRRMLRVHRDNRDVGDVATNATPQIETPAVDDPLVLQNEIEAA